MHTVATIIGHTIRRIMFFTFIIVMSSSKLKIAGPSQIVCRTAQLLPALASLVFHIAGNMPGLNFP